MPATSNGTAVRRACAPRTASGPVVVVRLYEHLDRDIAVAGERIEAHDVDGAHEALTHAQQIVGVLRTSLKPEQFQGGEDLVLLYDLLEHELVRASLQNDAAPLATCAAIVSPLHRAWARALDTEVPGRAPAEARRAVAVAP